MNIEKQVVSILGEVLGLNGRSSSLDRNTALLGAIPELDSMPAENLITSLEVQLGITVGDDEIDGATFGSVGSLVDCVAQKLNG